MKVAVFVGADEVIILKAKSKVKSKDDIEGFDFWFPGEPLRDVREYHVSVCDVGGESGVVLANEIHSHFSTREIQVSRRTFS